MTQYTLKTIGLFSGLFLFTLLISCSDPNAQAPAENQVHGTDWATVHGALSVADPFACTACHGGDYTGSGGAISCFVCHFDGPPFGLHPANWSNTLIDHRAYVNTNGISSCSLSACHGTNPFVQGGLTAPSCGSETYTDRNGNVYTCHTGHINGVSWLLPAAHASDAISDIARCWTCHAMTVPSPDPTAPACRTCHTASDPVMALGSCSSCHNNPPDAAAPAGNVRPNRSGEHNKHVNGEGIACSDCHQGFGSNTVGHWYADPLAPADVQFEASIALTLTYNGTNCTGTCHGKNHNDPW